MATPDEHGWLPIETAPKDGTWILIWCDFQIVGRWSDAGNRVKRGWTDDAWGVNPIHHVTQWQPLPKPPVGA